MRANGIAGAALTVLMAGLIGWAPAAAPFTAYAEAALADRAASAPVVATTGDDTGDAVPAAVDAAAGGNGALSEVVDGKADAPAQPESAVGTEDAAASDRVDTGTAAETGQAPRADADGAADGAGAGAVDAADASEPARSASPGGEVASPASAADELATEHIADLPDGTYTFTSAKTAGRVLEARYGYTAAGTAAQIWDGNGTDSQVWQVTHQGPYVVLANAKSGRALDLPDGRAVNGNGLRIWDPNGAPAQRWIAVKGADGSLELLSAVDPSKAVELFNGWTANGTAVQLYSRNGTAGQRWRVSAAKTSRDSLDELAAAHKADLVDGTYVATSSKDAAKAVAIAGTAVQLDGFSAKDSQRWTVSHDAKGYVTLTQGSSGKVLEAVGGKAGDGTRLQASRASGSWAQKWIAVKGRDGSFTLVSALDRAKVVECRNGWTQAGNPLQLYTANGTVAQTWSFKSVDAVSAGLKALAARYRGALADGTYAFVGGSASHRKVLEVAGGSTADGANVQIYTSNGTPAQRWRVTHDADGFVTLTSVRSGRALEVAGGYAAMGRNVQQWAGNGTAAQKWVLVLQADGSLQILSALWEGLALDIVDGRLANGVNVRVWSPNGAPAQSWHAVSGTVSGNVEAGKDVLEKGIWGSISSKESAGRVIGISGSSTADDATAQAGADYGILSQDFSFEWVDGYYRILNAKSGRALSLAAADVIPGGGLVQRTRSSDALQLFRATLNDDGSFTLVNKATGHAIAITGSSLSVAVPDGSASQHLMLGKRTYLISEGFFTIALATGSSVLDVANGSTDDGGGVQVYGSNGTFSQKWRISRVQGRDNVYTIEALNSGKRLSVLSNGQVRQQLASSSTAQQWSAEISGDAVVWRNVAHPDHVLSAANAVSGSAVGTTAAVSSSLQRWRLLGTDASIPAGVYQIRSARLPDNVLDVQDGSVAAGANVRIWPNNGSGAQKWTITRNGDGTYTILNARSHKALDLVDGRAANGANVRLWDPNGAPAQRWRISYASGGWKITSAVDPSFAIDAAGAQANPGANVQVYRDNGVAGQRYTFGPTSYVQEYAGFQNPAPFFQVSMNSVTVPHMGQGIFGYRTPSRIPWNATKQDCINAMITRAYDYLGNTPYIWDYSCAPGVGVDCAGLVMQALYATGMDLMPFNPWDHYYTPGHDQYANGMWDNPRFMHLDFSQRQRGDLVCYPGHIAIYLGNDQIIEAYSPAVGVRVSSVYSSPNIKGVLRPFV